MLEGITFEDDFEGKEPTGKVYESILKLVDQVTSLNASKKTIEDKTAMARSELETMIDQFQISEIETGVSTCKVGRMRRFKAWDNETEVFSLIPRRMQTILTLSPDKKKIDALIKKGKLPHELLDHQVITEFNQLRFKKV